jgi:hypothetical protein
MAKATGMSLLRIIDTGLACLRNEHRLLVNTGLACMEGKHQETLRDALDMLNDIQKERPDGTVRETGVRNRVRSETA